MIRRIWIPLLLLIYLSTGCSLLKLHPDAPADDGMSVSWEEQGDDRMVVTYTTTREQKGDEREPDTVPEITEEQVQDTIGSEHALLFAEIEKWMGTPYGYGRHELQKGTDCSGFTMEIYGAVYGIRLNRSSADQVANTTEIMKKDLQIGDLVFFNIRGNRISHVGLYIGNNKFVHSTVRRGVIISDLDESYYNQRYVRSGRVIRE
jgi:cell wall-associated NlpC family hydrolase